MTEIFDSNIVAIISAVIGATSTLVSQYILYRYRLYSSGRKFRKDIKNLLRHLSASLISLEISPDEPKYFLAARLRFCKFLDGVSSITDLEWLTKRRDSTRIIPTILAIRNSDIFLEEIALRIEHMNVEQTLQAIEDAKTNLRFLQLAVSKLGYEEGGEDRIFDARFAQRTLSELRAKKEDS